MTADAGRSLSPVAANRATLLRTPFYLAMSLLARLAPRDHRLWVFGRKMGVGEGPLAVLEALGRRDPSVRTVWLAQDAAQLADARARGLEAETVDSWRGRWLTLRAGVAVLSYGLADVARPFVPGAHVLQTWHGSPLKKIHLDESTRSVIGTGLLGRLGTRLMAEAVRRSGLLIGTIPAGSALVGERFRSAWRWPDSSRVAVVGDPRCDVLHRSSPESVAAARERLRTVWGEAALPRHLVLYAPTWRDGGSAPQLTAADVDVEFLDALERTDSWLVVRAHPLGTAVSDGLSGEATRRLRFASPADVHDLTGVLDAFDVLVSDYSAVAIDYAALLRPQVFFAPDVEDYLRTRGLYEDYDLFTGGLVRRDWAGTIAEVAAVLEHAERRAANVAATSEQLRARYHAFTDGLAADRVVDHVLARR